MIYFAKMFFNKRFLHFDNKKNYNKMSNPFYYINTNINCNEDDVKQEKISIEDVFNSKIIEENSKMKDIKESIHNNMNKTDFKSYIEAQKLFNEYFYNMK